MNTRLILMTSLATLMVASQAESGNKGKKKRQYHPPVKVPKNQFSQTQNHNQQQGDKLKEIADKFALKAKEELAEKKALAQENEDLRIKLEKLEADSNESKPSQKNEALQIEREKPKTDSNESKPLQKKVSRKSFFSFFSSTGHDTNDPFPTIDHRNQSFS